MTETIFKRYIPVEENSIANFIRVELYYDKGGMNYFTGRSERRGYYLSAVPVTRVNHGTYTTESFVFDTGIKMLVSEVPRKSITRETVAKGKAETMIPGLIAHVCNGKGLVVSEG